MRARALVDTLAPGVKARDTAERETPARLATSAAVTNARRTGGWPNSNARRCTRVHPSYAGTAHVQGPPLSPCKRLVVHGETPPRRERYHAGLRISAAVLQTFKSIGAGAVD